MDKKCDPTYIRLSNSNKIHVRYLSEQWNDLPESEVIDCLITLGYATYEFYQKHFGVFPIGLDFRPKTKEREDDSR